MMENNNGKYHLEEERSQSEKLRNDEDIAKKSTEKADNDSLIRFKKDEKDSVISSESNTGKRKYKPDTEEAESELIEEDISAGSSLEEKLEEGKTADKIKKKTGNRPGEQESKFTEGTSFNRKNKLQFGDPNSRSRPENNSSKQRAYIRGKYQKNVYKKSSKGKNDREKKQYDDIEDTGYEAVDKSAETAEDIYYARRKFSNNQQEESGQTNNNSEYVYNGNGKTDEHNMSNKLSNENYSKSLKNNDDAKNQKKQNSKEIQKKNIQRDYAEVNSGYTHDTSRTAARSAMAANKSAGAAASAGTSRTAGAAAASAGTAATTGAAATSTPTIIIIAVLIIVILIIMMLVVSCTLGGAAITGGDSSTSYQASESDIKEVEDYYCDLESQLGDESYLTSNYPGYDEYNYDFVNETGHNPYDLASLLTVWSWENGYNGDYNLSLVKDILDELFQAQYKITVSSETETRYRDVESSNLKSYKFTLLAAENDTEKEAYEVKILTAKVYNNGLTEVAPKVLNISDEDQSMVTMLSTSYGNATSLFPEWVYTVDDTYINYQPAKEALSDEKFALMYQEAVKYLGYKYQWGGYHNPSFDCSGFVSYVCNNCGVGWHFGHKVTDGLVKMCSLMYNESEAKPGDLVFFKNTYNSGYIYGVSHVGIYLGDGMMIDCGSSHGVSIRKVSVLQGNFLAYGRLPEP